MAKPRASDFLKAKQLGRYLSSNPTRGLYYHKRRSDDELLWTYAYCDASLYIHSVSGIAVFLGTPDYVTHINLNAAIISQTKQEETKVGSTMHSELLAMGRAVVAVEWVANMREEWASLSREPASFFPTASTPSTS